MTWPQENGCKKTQEPLRLEFNLALISFNHITNNYSKIVVSSTSHHHNKFSSIKTSLFVCVPLLMSCWVKTLSLRVNYAYLSCFSNLWASGLYLTSDLLRNLLQQNICGNYFFLQCMFKLQPESRLYRRGHKQYHLIFLKTEGGR